MLQGQVASFDEYTVDSLLQEIFHNTREEIFCVNNNIMCWVKAVRAVAWCNKGLPILTEIFLPGVNDASGSRTMRTGFLPGHAIRRLGSSRSPCSRPTSMSSSSTPFVYPIAPPGLAVISIFHVQMLHSLQVRKPYPLQIAPIAIYRVCIFVNPEEPPV